MNFVSLSDNKKSGLPFDKLDFTNATNAMYVLVGKTRDGDMSEHEYAVEYKNLFSKNLLTSPMRKLGKRQY